MRRFVAGFILLGTLAGSQAVQAQTKEFRSVSAVAVLLDGPSLKANKKFIAPKGMPLQILSTVEPFYKIRDSDGFEGFIEKKATSAQRTVLAITLVSLRQAAADGGAPVLQLERGVVLEVLDTSAKTWVKVRHADGAQGYVKATEVWGL
jgi:SH3-like domain-containing protein